MDSDNIGDEGVNDLSAFTKVIKRKGKPNTSQNKKKDKSSRHKTARSTKAYILLETCRLYEIAMPVI